jgi:hypothetical protein
LHLLAFGLPLTKMLLLAYLSRKVLQVLTQTMLLLPRLRPPLIQERQSH